MSITFGPVPSRRLGRSLGIDLLPLKTCTYNCVYCQLGPTERTTIRRRRFQDVETVIACISAALERDSGVDVLTFSGSGEPTLHVGLDRFIRAIKASFNLPVAILTNGALLAQARVREELSEADIVLPSMDAWTDEMYNRINRPHPTLKLQAVLEGLEFFRASFHGQLRLEIFFIPGVNDADRDLPGLLHWVERIQPDTLQINTAVRPPAENWVRPVSHRRLEEIRSALGPRAEIIVPFRGESEMIRLDGLEQQVEEMVNRRPVAPEDLMAALGMGQKDALAMLQRLSKRHGWLSTSHEGRVYFMISSRGNPEKQS